MKKEEDKHEEQQHSAKVIKENGVRKPNVQFITAIRGLYFTMQFLGIWPQTSPQNWYKMIWYIQSTGFAFCCFGPIAGLIVQRHDTRKIINSLGLVIPLTCISIKWVTFATQRKTIGSILRSLEEDWVNSDRNTPISQSVPDSKRTMMLYSKFANLYFYTYTTAIGLVIANYLRDSLVTRNSDQDDANFDKILPLPYSWYPFDYNRSFNIQFLAITQTVTATTFSLGNASMDGIFITVTLHLCGQFRILRHFVESIDYDSSRPEYCMAKVRLMVQRHQILLELGESLQQSYNFILLEQLVACTLSICFLGYILILEMQSNITNAMNILETGFLYLSALQTIFAYCLAGDHLTNTSIAVAMAVYNAPWYNFTRPINISLLLVMIRARKPVEITAAKLLPMSLESFTILMKAAASYLSVLRTMGVGVFE